MKLIMMPVRPNMNHNLKGFKLVEGNCWDCLFYYSNECSMDLSYSYYYYYCYWCSRREGGSAKHKKDIEIPKITKSNPPKKLTCPNSLINKADNKFPNKLQNCTIPIFIPKYLICWLSIWARLFT